MALLLPLQSSKGKTFLRNDNLARTRTNRLKLSFY
jgi:hypothetical protein